MTQKYFLGFVIILSLSLSINDLYCTELEYNRDTAIVYASDHCDSNSYNHEEYKTYDSDCANFVSQVIIAGFGDTDIHFLNGGLQ